MVSQVQVGRPLLGRFVHRLLAVPKLLVELLQLDLSVLEACTREAVVLFLISPVAVVVTMEEQEVNAMAAVVVGVPAILRAMSFSIYKVFMLEMEISPSWLSNRVHRLSRRDNPQVFHKKVSTKNH